LKKIIIGIHGLKNKAPKKLLADWWQDSIHEGLNKHCSDQDFHFELVYWADLNYGKSLDLNISDEDDPLFLRHPYIPGKETNEPANQDLKKKILDKIEIGMDKIFLKENTISGLEHITDLAIRKMFIDLDIYYHGNCRTDQRLNAKIAFRERLASVLKKYRKHEIMLVAHSMGTIISYDTLTQSVPNIKIDTFITLGSPLGNSLILKKILEEQNIQITEKSQPKTPQNIRTNWFNFADLNDKVALNYNLYDDFASNARGIKPTDVIINNNYVYNGQNNHHKVYGYLRSLQVAKVISEFLDYKDNFLTRLLKRLGVR
jgi:Lecithin:cholesterol acyltransferase